MQEYRCQTCFDCLGHGAIPTTRSIPPEPFTNKDGVGWLVIGDYGYSKKDYDATAKQEKITHEAHNLKLDSINRTVKIVAKKMDEVTSEEKIDWVLNTGDNFYV